MNFWGNQSCLSLISIQIIFYFSFSFPTGAVLLDHFLRYTIDPADMIPWLPAMPSADEAFPMTDRPIHQLSTGGTLHWVTAVTKHEAAARLERSTRFTAAGRMDGRTRVGLCLLL